MLERICWQLKAAMISHPDASWFGIRSVRQDVIHASVTILFAGNHSVYLENSSRQVPPHPARKTEHSSTAFAASRKATPARRRSRRVVFIYPGSESCSHVCVAGDTVRNSATSTLHRILQNRHSRGKNRHHPRSRHLQKIQSVTLQMSFLWL